MPETEPQEKPFGARPNLQMTADVLSVSGLQIQAWPEHLQLEEEEEEDDGDNKYEMRISYF